MEIEAFTHREESKTFLRTALAWQGSVNAIIFPRILITVLYATAVVYVMKLIPPFAISTAPFGFSGAVLGLLLVFRMNSGNDRWWEARKLWGSIVNQSRNLAIIGYEYTTEKNELTNRFLCWVAAFPHVASESLRQEKTLTQVEALLGAEEAQNIRNAEHMPTYVGSRLAQLLAKLRTQGLDDFAFQRAERERAILIDDIGACERILKTPIPRVLAIKTRQFIFIYLLLLPIPVSENADWFTPVIVGLAAYALFAIDEIGAQLQNPFSPKNLSHLPLSAICNTIEANVLGLRDKSQL